MPLQPHLKRIIEDRETLTREEAASLMRQLLTGDLNEVQLAALLAAFSMRGETPAEIAGFADVMRAAAIEIPLTGAERALLVDTCGTGADLSGTFNISTAAALVAAAAGTDGEAKILVAKHGNRAVTSQCGSADVLEALGIPVGLSPAEGAAAIRRHRFAFFHASALHPAMKTVMPVRRAVGIRTIFHLVGPLSNPAGASAQVMGVYAPHLVTRAAEAMVLLGARHAFVVHGTIDSSTKTNGYSSSGGAPSGGALSREGAAGRGLDEFSISGPTQVAEVRGKNITLSTIVPEDFGLRRAPIETLRGGSAATNAAILTAIFAGEKSPRRDVVLLNAAAVLVTAELAPDLPTGLLLAAETIDYGAVTELVALLKRNP